MGKKQVLKNTVALSTVLTVGFGLSGCYSSAEKLIQKIDSKKYDEALSYFSELELEQASREELITLLSKKLTETVSSYAANDIDYETATEIVETISQFQLEELVATIAVADVEIRDLLRSKTMYEDGKQALENEDYYSAIICFKNVISNDAFYETAMESCSEAEEKYTESVIKQVADLCADNNYQAALSILSTARDLLPNNEQIVNQIDKTLDEYEQHKYEVAKKELIEDVNKLINRSDFEEALVNINRFMDYYDTKDEDVTALYTTCKERYETLILNKVNELRNEKKYLKAIEIITNAQEVVESEKFASILSTLEAEKPIYLCDVKCQNSNRFELITSGDLPMDTIGNRYELSNLYIVSSENESWSEPDYGYADYYLGYKYKSLSGVVAVDDASDNVSCVLEIIGDGVVLDSIYLDRLTAPTAFNVDVSNVNVLTIKLNGPTQSDTVFYVILSEHCFEK